MMDLTHTRSSRKAAQSRSFSASLRRLTVRRAVPLLTAGALMLPAGIAGAAPVTLTTGDLINTTSFNTAGNWSNAATPSAANDYTVNGPSAASIFNLRTPGDFSNYTFAGNSLTIGAFGSLLLKGNGANVYAVNNLILDGGSIANGNGGTIQTVGGTITLTANGGIFDTSNDASRVIILNATIGGVGGILKSNNGTVALNGSNTYAGATTINGGILSVGSNSSLGATPAAATANNIILNGGVLSANTSFTLSSNRGIGIGATTGATAATGTLDVLLGQTLTYGGVIASAGNTAADILAKTGTGTLVLSGANTYTGGTLVNGGALQFSSVGAIPVTGSITVNAGGALSAAGAYTTVNDWLNSGRIVTTSTGAIGLTGDSAETIDLSSSAYTAIMLGSNVANANYAGTLTPNAATYRLGGGTGTLTLINANTLTGANSLVVGANGSGGTVAVTNTNNYTGTTTVNGSTLQIGNGGTTGSLGLSSAAPLTSVGGGNIVTANNGTVALNRSDNLTLSAGTVTGTGRFQKLGTNTLTMTGTGSLGSYFASNGTLLVGTGTSLTSTSFTSIGLNPGDNAVVTVNGTGSYIATGDFNVTDLSGSQATLNIADNAIVKANTLYVGKGTNAFNSTGAGTLGTVNQTGGTVSPNAGGNDWRIGGGSLTNSAAVGVYNISGGTLTTASNFQVGAYGNGTLNISGTGAVTLTGGYTDSGRFTGSVGNINVTGGSLNQNTNNKLIVGENGTGTVTVGNGTANSGAVNLQGGLVMGLAAGSNGTFNLNTGGTLTTPSISGTNNTVGTAAGAPAGNGTFNFNGGTLTVTASNGVGANGAYMAVTTANVQSGGAVINTNGNNVTVTQSLLHSGAGKDGGLTKTGAGTLTLSGADTYTGATTVSAGQLALTTISSLGSGNLLLPDSATNWVNLLFTGTENIAGLSFNLGSTFAPGGTYGAVGSGATFTSAAFTGTGILNVAAAPEPSQYAAFGLGLLGLGGLALRARRRSAS